MNPPRPLPAAARLPGRPGNSIVHHSARTAHRSPARAARRIAVVVPLVDCVTHDAGAGTVTAEFGYVNPGAATVTIDYGPNNSDWHSPKDTMDKLSAKSLEIVGNTVLQGVGEIK